MNCDVFFWNKGHLDYNMVFVVEYFGKKFKINE